MENVVAFNNELSGLYENKPPISKAKMAAITRSAMRAIKFYKHVVQSVEKFILKCKSEYKVPGLYVIDSIVRQSRHQFGPEKDVFAPRFARNIKETFSNLFLCAAEDKSKIIRVLNLWQKNSVFAPEVIQPLFDFADPNHSIYQIAAGSATGVGSGGPSGNGTNMGELSSTSNGLNLSGTLDASSMAATVAAVGSNDEKGGVLPDLKNNLKQLLNDPNVLRQLQTLQNFQKFKQQEEHNKKHKLNEMRLQEDAFEKHLQNVLKASAAVDDTDFNKEVQFISEEKGIEVINLDGNDSRSPTPNRDSTSNSRYKRRRSRSRSRDRSRSGRDRNRRRSRSRSRSRDRSPRSNRRRSSRDRSDRNNRSDNNRDKEKEREHERERRKKGLPELKKEYLTVCSTTLWVGHLSKLVYQEELSDTFGEYGDIVSIDQIVPRGCAFIVMNRRQDANKAMTNLKNHKLQGRAITISWAAGKGVKSKEWKDYWDLELGATYIPWSKLDENTDLESLEEGGMFDEDTMPPWMKNKIVHLNTLKEKGIMGAAIADPSAIPGNLAMFNIDTTQPPPGPPTQSGGPTPLMSMVPGQFPMAPPPPRMIGSLPIGLSGISLPPNMVPGMPPPHPLLMPTPGMLTPNFPSLSGQGASNAGANIEMGSNVQPFVPPPHAGTMPLPNLLVNNANDDQMDIEMDDEDAGLPPPAAPSLCPPQGAISILNFTQPPPMFGSAMGVPSQSNLGDTNVDAMNRERNRLTAGGSNLSSRWNGRSGDDNGNMTGNSGGLDGPQRWRDSFGNGGGPLMGFNDGRNGGGNRGPMQMNIPPLDLNNPPQRPDFMNEFDNRSGGGVRARSNHNNGEFFPNMPNRFNQPTSLLQMRIPPPNSFNVRMSGGGGGGGVGGSGPGVQAMFMRAGPGGVAGNTGPNIGGGNGPNTTGSAGRQQQGAGFFNPRNPFDRDNRNGGRGLGRGNNRGGPGGGGGGIVRGDGRNWSDEEEENTGIFKRRTGNRFRDRNDGGADEQHNNTRGGGRRGAPIGQRMDRDGEENDNKQLDNRNNADNRRNSRDDKMLEPTERVNRPEPSTTKNGSEVKSNSDNEDDWDKELEEYDARMAAENAAEEAAASVVEQSKAEDLPSATVQTQSDVNDMKVGNQNNSDIEQQPNQNIADDTIPSENQVSAKPIVEITENITLTTVVPETAATTIDNGGQISSQIEEVIPSADAVDPSTA